MKLSVFAPKSKDTGISSYVATLVRSLKKYTDVYWNPSNVNGLPIYHLGNNHLHALVYEKACKTPGIVVLHEVTLNHFFLGRLSREEYIREFVFNYGEWYRDFAGKLYDQRATSAANPIYFRYTLLKRLAERTPLFVVHSRAAREWVLREFPKARVEVIPHLVNPVELPSIAEVYGWRARFGIEPNECVVAVFGHLRETKRLQVVCHAVEQLRQRGHRIRLLLAGRFANQTLQKALEPAVARLNAIYTGYLSAASFRLAAAATDICVNLRYPWAGETSGVAILLMWLGKPVVFSDGTESTDYPIPEDLRVRAGASESRQLVEVLEWLLMDSRLRTAIGALCHEYLRRKHHPEDCARQLLCLAEALGS